MSQSSDMIKLHAQMFKKHGMSSIRNFDALNDVNNLKWSGQCIHDAGLNHEVVVTMMGLPPGIDNKGTHTPEFYRDTLKKIMDAGIPFDRVAFKDASGTSTPATVYNTMKLARQLLGDKIHIQFHSHETAGNGVACYLAALKGGADGIDWNYSVNCGVEGVSRKKKILQQRVRLMKQAIAAVVDGNNLTREEAERVAELRHDQAPCADVQEARHELDPQLRRAQ